MNINKIVEVGASDYNNCFSRQFVDSGIEIHLFEPNVILFNDLSYKLRGRKNLQWLNIYCQAISNDGKLTKFYNYGYASYLKGQKCLANTHMDLDNNIADYDTLLEPLSSLSATIAAHAFTARLDENTYLSINCNGAENLILTNLIKLPAAIRMVWYAHNQIHWEIINNNRNILNTLNYQETVKYKNKLGTFYELEYIRR